MASDQQEPQPILTPALPANFRVVASGSSTVRFDDAALSVSRHSLMVTQRRTV